jgi:hypothetical protein
MVGIIRLLWGVKHCPKWRTNISKIKRLSRSNPTKSTGGQERTDRRNRRADLAAERREKRGTEPPLLLCGEVGLWRRRIGASGEEEEEEGALVQ